MTDLFGGTDERGAILDATRRYRYLLWRTADPGGTGRLLYVMLNPSIADADIDDQTIKRCRHFAARHGVARFDVVNLFAYRATHPTALLLVDDPVGPRNDLHIREAADQADMVVIATGDPYRLAGCAERYADVLAELGRVHPARFWTLGLTERGWPRHPSRLPNSARLEPFPQA